MKNILNYCLLISTFTILSSCEEEEVPAITESYLRIIDDQDYNAEFKPISIQETSTGGSIILTATEAQNSDFESINIIRLDSLGGYRSEFFLTENYVTPVGDLMKVDNTLYFFCMEEGTLFVNLVAVDERGVASDPIRVSGGLRYPLAASLNSDNNFMLLSYDPINGRSIISIIQTDGSLINSQGYSIGAGGDNEPDILDHLTNPSIQYPFL